jgi:predicted tellurium resistance membrane protein TerC
MELLLDPHTWVSFLALTALEIILGIDNVIFLSLVTDRLSAAGATRARQIGLLLALVFRILLLFGIVWVIALRQPLFGIYIWEFSLRDILLIAGGLFLIVKATQEVHGEIEGDDDNNGTSMFGNTLSAVVGQIVVIDAIFSIDSIITAVGMAERIEIMIAAIVVAVGVMYVAVTPVSRFIEAHPTTKMLALSFLMLIGVALVADGFHFHVPRSYIYFAMAFAAVTEIFNIMAIRRRLARQRRPRSRKKS